MSAVLDLCDRWDHYSKGESPTTKAIRAAHAEDQEQAMTETIEPCPECVQGKHVNCDGTAWDQAKDEPGPCPCHLQGHPT